jgi:hypothetical protein
MNRPGSESGAEVWDGFSRNLGDPAFDQPTLASGTGLERDQALRTSPPHGSELGEGSVGAEKRIDKRLRCRRQYFMSNPSLFGQPPDFTLKRRKPLIQ